MYRARNVALLALTLMLLGIIALTAPDPDSAGAEAQSAHSAATSQASRVL